MNDSASLSILLVDDDPAIRLTMKTLLEAHGFAVVGEASDGQDGVAAFMKLSPDVVLLDVDMPKMMGVDALRAILEHDKAAKVVMLTSIDATGVIDDAITIGAKDYLRKDGDLAGFPDRIRKIVG